jgi:hypothetical protein
MAAVGDVGATSFDSYEGIRIVIPGALVTGLLVAAERTFAVHGPNPIAKETSLALLVALAAGLLLYFVDLPTKSAGYNQESQPTNYLNATYGSSADSGGLKPGEILNRYLLLLSTEVPGTIRNRTLYMGSMYRIAFESILVAATVGYAVMVGALVHTGERPTPHYWRAMCWSVLGGFLIAAVIAWVSAVNYARKRAYRDQQGEVNRAKKVRDDARAALRVPHTAIYYAGLVLLVLAPWCPGTSRWRIAGGFITLTYWVARYTVGDPPRDDDAAIANPRPIRAFRSAAAQWVRRYTVGTTEQALKLAREPMDPIAAGVLFALPLIVWWAQLLTMHRTGVGQPGAMVGWAVVHLALFALITSRGHERKLHGAYQGQQHWLRLNPTICNAFFALDGGPEKLAELRALASPPTDEPPSAPPGE